jgi:hypothetical protein
VLTPTLTGKINANGTPHINWVWDGSSLPEGSGCLVTGPDVSGIIRLKDGTTYDVTPEVIEHAPGHAGPICHHIEKILEASGRLGELRPEATHTCTEACGAEAE